jgi:hypothetical protein
LVEDNFPFEREDCPGVILGFLNSFLGSRTIAIGYGSSFFLVTCFFVKDEEVGGILGPLPSLLGARITTEESPGKKYTVWCKYPKYCPPSRFGSNLVVLPGKTASFLHPQQWCQNILVPKVALDYERAS